jgi:hypothetical protein
VRRLEWRPTNRVIEVWEETAFVNDAELAMAELIAGHAEYEREHIASGGRLTYLLALADQGEGVDRNCPICLEGLGQKFKVLGCGHTVCSVCIKPISRGRIA